MDVTRSTWKTFQNPPLPPESTWAGSLLARVLGFSPPGRGAISEIKWSRAVGERAQARDPTTLLGSALTNSASAERERKLPAPRGPWSLWLSTRCFRARTPWRSGPQCPSQRSGLPVTPRSRVPAVEGWAEPGPPPTWPRPARPSGALPRPERLAPSARFSAPGLPAATSSSRLRAQPRQRLL